MAQVIAAGPIRRLSRKRLPEPLPIMANNAAVWKTESLLLAAVPLNYLALCVPSSAAQLGMSFPVVPSLPLPRCVTALLTIGHHLRSGGKIEVTMRRAIALLAGMIACATASAQSTALAPALQPDPRTSTTDCEQQSKFANDDVGTMLRDWRTHPPEEIRELSTRLYQAESMDLDYIVIPLPDAANGMHRIQISHEKPQPVVHPDPEYSPEAADKGVKGIVKLKVFVAQDGAVKKNSLVCGNPLLVPAAQAALQKWTYRPVLLNDQPVEFVINKIELRLDHTIQGILRPRQRNKQKEKNRRAFLVRRMAVSVTGQVTC